MVALPARVRGLPLPALTLPRVWGLAALATIFASSGLRGTIGMNDFWWHLKVGEIIATTRHIPTTDTFSFTAADTPYFYQQWLGALYLYAVFRLGGIELVVLANTLLLTATAALVLLAAWEASGNLRIASICAAVGMLIAQRNVDARPQTLGFLFFALFYLLLLRYRQGARVPLWLLPVVAAVWANVHGSVILGVGLAVLVLIAELLKAWLRFWPNRTLPRRKLMRLAAMVAATMIALLLNPRGLGLLDYLLTVQRNSAVQTWVLEWFAPSFRNPEDVPFFVALLACVAIFALCPDSLDLTDTVLFVVFSILALQALRNSVWFGIVAGPIAARQVAATVKTWRTLPPEASVRAARNTTSGSVTSSARGAPARVLASYLCVALLAALSTFTLPWVKPHLSLPDPWRGLVDGNTPAAAVSFVAGLFPEQRFFHPDTYGTYMIWASAARPPVFVDGRVELYPDSVWQDYLAISLAEDWEARLAKYGIRHVLLAKRTYKGFQQALLVAIRRSPDWAPIYEDENAIVYVKR